MTKKTKPKGNSKGIKIPKINNKIVLTIATFILGFGSSCVIREIPTLEAKNNTAILEDEYSFADDQQSFPKGLPIIYRSCYSLNYDCRTKNANWVYERITAENLKGDVDRENFKFKEDPSIPQIFRSTLKDYQGSGFDRGHLAPAANHKNSADAMGDTFYLSNMSPQNPQFNRGYWSKFEKHVRDLTKYYLVVESFTGPLYLPHEDENGNKWVKYRVIGKNDVAVPTHFYKVLFLENSSGRKDIEAYILPNATIDAETPLNKFQTTLQKIEKASGVIFTYSNMCVKVPCIAKSSQNF